MPVILHCRDAGFDCDAVVHGETFEEVLRQVRPHASSRHEVQVTPAVETLLRGLVSHSAASHS